MSIENLDFSCIDEASGEETDLESVSGIGAYTSEKLNEQGVRTVEQLRSLSNDELIEMDGIGLTRIKQIRETISSDVSFHDWVVDSESYGVDMNDIPWESLPESATKETIHQLIQSYLVNFGERCKYTAVPEASHTNIGKRKRIDVVWYEDGESKVAFEIDPSFRESNIAKLKALDCKCVQIMKSHNESTVKSRVDEVPESIDVLDAEMWDRDLSFI